MYFFMSKRNLFVFLGVLSLFSPIVLGNNFYLTTFVNISNLAPVKEYNRKENFKLSHESSALPSVGGGFGYYINDKSRVDLIFQGLNFVFDEDSGNFNYKKNNTYVTGVKSVRRRVTGHALKLNYYIDVFNKENSFKIFIGTGAGIAQIKERKGFVSAGNFINNGVVYTFPAIVDKFDGVRVRNFTYSLMIGASKKFNSITNLDLTYSWQDYGKTKVKLGDITMSHPYKGHHLSLGVRFDL